MHEDEDIDLVAQSRHTGHDIQELFRGRQVVVCALKGLESTQLILLGSNLRTKA